MSARQRVADWCAAEVYGWLGFMLCAALASLLAWVGLVGSAVIVYLQATASSGPLWLMLIPALPLGVGGIWLLSLLMRCRGAPWGAMLLLAVAEGLACWHWLDQPFSVLR